MITSLFSQTFYRPYIFSSLGFRVFQKPQSVLSESCCPPSSLRERGKGLQSSNSEPGRSPKRDEARSVATTLTRLTLSPEFKVEAPHHIVPHHGHCRTEPITPSRPERRGSEQHRNRGIGPSPIRAASYPDWQSQRHGRATRRNHRASIMRHRLGRH